MNYEFDANKNELNKLAHGVDMAAADSFDWESALGYIDNRNSYGELRIVAFGLIGPRLHCIVYTN
ncbi:MAG: BrnT family toxin [Pseudomonadales bacterium]